jgi:hypothetical protein
MKKTLLLSAFILIIPTLSYADKSYFLACQDGTMINTIYNHKSRNYKRGDIFEIPTQAVYKHGDKTLNNDPRGTCWSDTGETKCPVVVYYGNSGGAYQHGYANLGSGIWFKTDNKIPIKSNAAEKLLGAFGSLFGGSKEENFDNFLDKEFVDVMCSEHPTKFEVSGNTFIDIKKEKSEVIAKKTEDARQQQIVREEQLRKGSEEKTRQAEANEAVKKECKKILGVYYQEYNNKVRSKASGYPAKEFLPDVIIKIDQDSRDILVIQHNLMSATIAFDILDIKKLKEVVYKSNVKTLVFQNKETYWWWEACEQDSNPEVLLNRKGKKPQSRIEYERTESEIKARIDYANQLEKSYLARGRDMQVTAENTPDGSDIKKALLFHYTFMDKSIAYNIVKDPGFRKAVKSLGFDQVHFVAVRSNHPELNSYVYYVHEQKLYKVWGKDEGLYIE